MNRHLVFLGTLAAVLLVSAVGYGQREGQKRQGQKRQQGQTRARGMLMARGMSLAMLLRIEEVRKEIGATQEQTTKLRELASSDRQRTGSFRDMSDEERKKAQADRAKVAAKQQKMIEEILDDKQKKRLKEIRIQTMGSSVLMVQEIAKELGISDEQRKKMRDAGQKMRDAVSGDERPSREDFAKMRKEIEAAIADVLTEEQTAKLEKMKGEPFDMPQRRGGRGN